MANGHGGARPGAGRKRKAETFAQPIAATEQRIAERLADRVAALELLAEGGFEQVTETWEMAGLIYLDETDFDTKGKAVKRRVRAFPDLPPEQLVCIRRVRSIAAPDRRANEYLIDRILGRPVAAVEGEIDLADPNALLDRFEAAIAKVYGDSEDDEQ